MFRLVSKSGLKPELHFNVATVPAGLKMGQLSAKPSPVFQRLEGDFVIGTVDAKTAIQALG